jgi:hypothetical protein
MLRTALFELLFTLCLLDPASAQNPSARTRSSEFGQKVEQLVRDLDAQSRSVRVAARESLIKLGPAVLPFLPDVDATTSEAARDALRGIHRRLDRQAALDTLGPSRVTIHGKLPVRAILQQITAQTGNDFDVQKLDPKHLSREILVADRARPFWSATDNLVQRAGLAFAGITAGKQIELAPMSAVPTTKDLAIADDSAFRVAVASATLRSSSEDVTKNSLRVEWTLTAEPRLRPLFARISGGDFAVRAPDGVLMTPVAPNSKLEISLAEGVQSLRLDSDFDVPEGAEPNLIEFSGSLHVEMAVGPRRFVFSNLNSGRHPTQHAGEVTVKLQRAELHFEKGKLGTARVELAVAYARGGAAFESFRNWMFNNEVLLETHDGRRIAPQPIFSTDRQDDGTVVVQYNFVNLNDTANDYRLVYTAPTLITDFPVAFRFATITITRSP